jgi:hypothetical protein
MSALDDFTELLDRTEVMKQLINTLKQEPAHLLGDICREYKKTGKAVPDHNLRTIGYMGEAAIRALASAGLIIRSSGGLLSLYVYEPTDEGLKQYKKLKDEEFYKR